jgi:hypothetical protein
MSLAVADWLVGISVMPPAVALHIMGKLKSVCFSLFFTLSYRQVREGWLSIDSQHSKKTQFLAF